MNIRIDLNAMYYRPEHPLTAHDGNFANGSTIKSSPAVSSVLGSSRSEEIQKLQERVQQRDDEISIAPPC